jgi:hypothetical protein
MQSLHSSDAVPVLLGPARATRYLAAKVLTRGSVIRLLMRARGAGGIALSLDPPWFLVVLSGVEGRMTSCQGDRVPHRAKTASELAVRTLALLLMAVYAEEGAVANSSRTFSRGPDDGWLRVALREHERRQGERES